MLCVDVDGLCDPVVLCDEELDGHCDPLCDPGCELPAVELLSCATMLPASNTLANKINQLFLMTKSPNLCPATRNVFRPWLTARGLPLGSSEAVFPPSLAIRAFCVGNGFLRKQFHDYYVVITCATMFSIQLCAAVQTTVYHVHT